MERKKIRGVEQMEQFARKFLLEYLDTKNKERATTITLFGDLGSGKTTFTRFLAHSLGVRARVTSPTFVIEKRYKIFREGSPFQKLIHIDAYRLSGLEVDEVLGLEETLNNPKNLICIEWPENISNIERVSDIEIYFEFVDKNTRAIKIQNHKP